MPYGAWINDFPTGFFLVVHIAAFAVGAGFAWLAFKRELSVLGVAFSLFAVAELVYMTYHLDWTVFLFAHTIAEVLDLTAFVLVFAAAVYAAVRRPALDTVEVNR
jgi:membrane protein implicated in regulation of membrane protease activity